MSLITVGTVAFDDIETPYGKARKIVGGAATYISLSASYFTKDIQLVSVIGDDFPKEVLEDLKSRGVDLEGLQIKKGEKSFFWAGKYHENMNGRDTLDTQLNVLADFNPVLPASYKNAEYVMLGNLVPAIQMQVIDQLESRPKLIALDTMDFWMDNALEDLKKVLKKIDVLIINDEEARQLSGEHFLVGAAEIIQKMGPKTVVIKKGEHGALLFQGEEMFYAPALPLKKVFDPTGAGDTFAGGFMGYIAKTGDTSFENMKKAIVAGSALASFCVEAFGTEKIASLDVNNIKERIEKFSSLVNFGQVL